MLDIDSLIMMLTYISLAFLLAILTDRMHGRICVFNGGGFENPFCTDDMDGKIFEK